MQLFRCFYIIVHIIYLTCIHAITEHAIYIDRHDLILQNRADPEVFHDCIFATTLNNLEILKNILNDVSNPDSPSYGQYMNHDAIGTMWQNEEAVSHVLGFANTHGIAIVEQSPFGEFITARASIRVWERLLSAEFHVFDRLDSAGENLHPILRANHYTIPATLTTHVDAIFNTVQMPIHVKSTSPYLVHGVGDSKLRLQDTTGSLTPSLLISYYGINAVGNSNGSQVVYSTIHQNYSPEDLTKFQTKYHVPVDPVSESIGGHNSSAVCYSQPSQCKEANLDVQYLMAIGQNVKTITYYENSTDFVLGWIMRMSSMADPPLVTSISYGAAESTVPKSYFNSFETTMLALSLKGVTVIAGSGDDGVGGTEATKGSAFCSYSPVWPASSPYVLAVGATQGPESSAPEVTCAANTGGTITSGGGFSNVYGQPDWQQEAVSEYFTTAALAGKSPLAGYNTSGRAYPDVAVMGHAYEVYIGGNLTLISGTSAATPVVAGMISIINSHRISAGRKPLGWINKVIYQNYSLFARDIQSGNNSCTTNMVCCAESFQSLLGWDPATGFGSIDFPNFYNVFFNMGFLTTRFPTAAPTVTPTPKPSTPPTPRPSRRPSVNPTRVPTAPTPSPSFLPTLAPTSSGPIQKKSPLLMIIIIVAVVAVIIAGGVYYYFCWGDDDEEGEGLIEGGNKVNGDYVGIAMNAFASNILRNQSRDDEYFGELMEEEEFRDFHSNNRSENDPVHTRIQQEGTEFDVEAANMEMLENVLFSADTNEYEEAHSSMFDHILETDISSSVKKLGLHETDLENFLFSADANEYGVPASSVFGSVAAKSVATKPEGVCSEFEDVMFSADTNEYSVPDETIVHNPIVKFAKEYPTTTKKTADMQNPIKGPSRRDPSTPKSVSSSGTRTPKHQQPTTPKLAIDTSFASQGSSDQANASPKQVHASPRANVSVAVSQELASDSHNQTGFGSSPRPYGNASPSFESIETPAIAVATYNSPRGHLASPRLAPKSPTQSQSGDKSASSSHEPMPFESSE